MSKRNRRRTPPSPTVVFDYGGVLSAGHDPVPALHELLGGDIDALRGALWSHRDAYDRGENTPAEYWGAVAAAAGVDQLSETEVGELQTADNRYFLRMDPASRELLHDLARNGVRLALLSNASESFGEAVRRADWFEAFTVAIISGEEHTAKPGREIFEILLDVLAHETGGVSIPSAIIFFDDREENVAAAKALGIDAHLWPRNGGEQADAAVQAGAAEQADAADEAGSTEQADTVEHGTAIARRVLAERGVPQD